MLEKNNYLYVRELYSNQYYSKQYYIQVILENSDIKYLYFDKEKHIKLTSNIKYASKFSHIPKNLESYSSYIKNKYPNSKIYLKDFVIIKNKY